MADVSKNPMADLFDIMREKVAESNIKKNQSSSSNPSYPTIYQIPESLRKLKETAYTPRVVSIGPLHNTNQHLKHMEPHKVSYMCSLLCRTKKGTEDDHVVIKREMRNCGNAVLEMVDRARACYAESSTMDAFKDNVKFAEILLLDGFFILEFLYRDYKKEKYNNDPFSNSLPFLYITHDLFLLENQIPLFVLEKLFELSIQQIQPQQIQPVNHEVSVDLSNVTDLILTFYKDMINKKNMAGNDSPVDHILGLMHKCYLPFNGEPSDKPIIQYSATQLDRAGIKFKASRDTLQVKFTPPIFEIPPLRIDDITEPFLRNLIAFEQCSPVIQRNVTSYAYLMDTLINTNKDVELLEMAKVVENNLGASEFASDLINSICNEVLLGKFSYYNQWAGVDKYCKRFWPRNIERLRRDYFYSPWAIVSVIAGLIFSALTILQTFNFYR